MLTMPSLIVVSALVTPLDFMGHLDGVRSAWQIEDPLERCLALPEIPGTSWPEGVWEGYCRFRHAHSRTATLSEINQLLDAEDAAGLNALFTRYLDQHYSDPNERDILHFAMDRFGSTEGLEAAQRWHYLDPESAFSNAALARALARASHRARGTAFASETTAEQFDAMRELAALAMPYALTALDIEPRMYSACIDLVHLGRIESQFLVELAGVESCRGADPSSVVLYEHWILSVQPKWGGSTEEMNLVKFEALQYLDSNPLLSVVVLSAEGDLIAEHIPGRSGEIPSEMADLIAEEVRQAPEMLRLLAQGRISGSANDSLAAIAYIAAYIALNPDWNEPYAHYLLGFHLYRTRNRSWAASEFTRAVELGWADNNYIARRRIAWALVLEERLEASIYWWTQLLDSPYVAEAVDNLAYAYTALRDLESATPFIDRLMQEYPTKVSGWRLAVLVAGIEGRHEVVPDLIARARIHAQNDEEWQEFLGQLDLLEASYRVFDENSGKLPPIP